MSVLRLMTFVLLMTLTAPVWGQTVGEVFVADPFYNGGGYWELTVNNETGGDVFLLIVGNNGADVVFTHPSLVGLWYPSLQDEAGWTKGESFGNGAGFTPPNTTEIPWNEHFAGYAQVVMYYTMEAGTPIADGETRGGFRFLSGLGGSPFLLFDGAGNIVAEGETNTPLPADASTWGRVKAMYR